MATIATMDGATDGATMTATVDVVGATAVIKVDMAGSLDGGKTGLCSGA